jgi:hypothetical protein
MWVGSLFASGINRKCSHFNRGLEFSLLTILNKLQKKFCDGLGFLIRIQTILILNSGTSCNLTSNLLILLSISFIQFDKAFSKN